MKDTSFKRLPWRMLQLMLLFLTVLYIFPEKANGQTEIHYHRLREAFIHPPDSVRPKAYWWCLNGNIDTVRAKAEIRAMKTAGLTGFDLFEIGVPARDTMIPGGPAFMSDASVELIRFAVKEAGKLGLTVGLNLSSSWNAGGSWTKPHHAGKSLYHSVTYLSGDRGKQTLILPFPEISFPGEAIIGANRNPLIHRQKNGRPVYSEEIAVLALPADRKKNGLEPEQVIDITPYFNPDNDKLTWDAPPGNWEIHRYVCSNSGQQLVLPSPLSGGLTIDHFDAEAVETHLMYIINKLLPVLGDFRKTALKSFYLASYEARGMVWTPVLPEEFRKINGYDIRKYIPALVYKDLFCEPTTKKIHDDFKKTLSELMINNLYRKSKEICNRYGLKINSEAGGPGFPLYNGPAEPLKALGALDIPRGEFWINHSRFYPHGNDSIDILRVVKEISAASHIYRKGIVEEEAFTSFQHWQEGPGDMKPFGDRAFCEGMNRVVFHGFSHNITGSGFPGYVYGAGTHFNDKRVWWPTVRPFTEYLSGISAVFREMDFVADVLWYYGDKVPNSAAPKNTRFTAGPGYDYEVINTDILLNHLSCKNGKLLLSNGAEFSLMVIENEESVRPDVLQKLHQLVIEGAIISGEKPEFIGDNPDSEPEKNLATLLWPEKSSLSLQKQIQQKQIISGVSTTELLKFLNVKQDINYPDIESSLIDFIHFRKNSTDVYFVRNTKNEWLSLNMVFRQFDKTPEIWNPVTGEVIPVNLYNQTEEGLSIPVTLPPYGSNLFVFGKPFVPAQFTGISCSGTEPPPVDFTNRGMIIPEDGTFTLTVREDAVTIKNKIHTQTINGPWEVHFAKGWGAPEKVIFPELISWTDSENIGIKYYSGSATYHKTFRVDKTDNPGKNPIIFLDLGEISKTAEVWLNGEFLGIVWTKPYRLDISDKLLDGNNSLIIKIFNVWSNRLTGDAILGESYTHTNITSTIIPAPTMETGDQARIPWARVPLIRSGLIGPVEIKTYYPLTTGFQNEPSKKY